MTDSLLGGQASQAPEGGQTTQAPEGGQANQAPAGGQGTDVLNGGGQASSGSWLDSIDGIDPEIKSDPSLKAIKDIPSLVKSYVHAQKMVGANKVVLPNKNSSEQEIKEFYAKMGLPEFEQYTLQPKEETALKDDFIESFKKMAYENNLLPEQAQKVYDFLDENTKQALAKMEEEKALKAEEAVRSLKEEWSTDFDMKLNQARLAVKEFGGEELQQYLSQTGLGNDPQIIKLFQRIGDTLLKEDSFKGPYKQAFGMSIEEAKKRIGELTGDINSPYYNENHGDHRRVVEEVNKLYERLMKNS